MQLFCEPSVGKEDSEEMDLLKEEETELRALLDKLRGLQESHGVYSLAVKAMLAERLQTHRPDSMLSDPACASLGVGESVPKALLCRLKMQSFRQWRKKNCGIGDSDPLKALQRKLRADIANAAGKRIIEPAGNRPSLLPVESFHRKVMAVDEFAPLGVKEVPRPIDPETLQKQKEIELQRQKEHYEVQMRERQRMEEEERIQREAEEMQVKKRYVRRLFIQDLSNHVVAFKEFHNNNSKIVPKLATGIVRHIERLENKKKSQEDKTRRLRMKALRENNMEEYSKLVQQHKNDRLSQLLDQTADYMRQIGAKVDEGNESGVGASIFEGKVQEEITEQPEMLQFGKLKNYQIQGLQWLVSLYNNGLNGILADEMGLGKTIQTISLLCYLMEKKGDHGPFLVIAPLSTISNWRNEFERWAPGITLVSYSGKPEERRYMNDVYLVNTKFNVLLTTYEYILNKSDRRRLEKIDWHYIIVDEGHRMKNKQSKFSQALATRYRSKHRLILTGTPLQNNLQELWSLLNFLLPKVFNSSDNFEAWFNKPFESACLDKDNSDLQEEEKLLVINRLHQVLRPFLLRRLKTEVAKEMPDKIEIVIKCALSAWQEIQYKHIQNRYVMTVDLQSGHVGSKGLNNTFMQLRKICNHPYLFFDDDHLRDITAPGNISSEIIRSAGKFDMLEQMLPKLYRTGHRVLIFSQMTKCLDLMEDYLEWKGYKFVRLDGTTKQTDRAEKLRAFNDDNSDIFIFLLSTRAGGLGLNLQKADTVIIFDSDWNPQMDLQAQDRAHRIGQTKEVRVFRLITLSPIEEQILERATHKLGLDHMIIQAGKFNKESTASERKQLLETILRSGVDMGKELRLPSAEEFNTMLSRSEEEIELFTKMDEEDEAERLREWRERGNSGNPPPRLMTYDEIPEYLKRDIESESLAQSFQEEDLGRGRRRKTEVKDENIINIHGLSDKDFDRLLAGDIVIDEEDGGEEEDVEEIQINLEKQKMYDFEDTSATIAPSTAAESSEDTTSLKDQLKEILDGLIETSCKLEGIYSLPEPDKYPEFYSSRGRNGDIQCLQSIQDRIEGIETFEAFAEELRQIFSSSSRFADILKKRDSDRSRELLQVLENLRLFATSRIDGNSFSFEDSASSSKRSHSELSVSDEVDYSDPSSRRKRRKSRA